MNSFKLFDKVVVALADGTQVDGLVDGAEGTIQGFAGIKENADGSVKVNRSLPVVEFEEGMARVVLADLLAPAALESEEIAAAPSTITPTFAEPATNEEAKAGPVNADLTVYQFEILLEGVDHICYTLTKNGNTQTVLRAKRRGRPSYKLAETPIVTGEAEPLAFSELPEFALKIFKESGILD